MVDKRVVIVVVGLGAAPIPSVSASPLDGARQLIVVTTRGWDGVQARVARFERGRDGWRPVGEPRAAVVGRAGLAWGRGLHGVAPAGTRGGTKREGDGRSPAGAFRVEAAFGIAPAPQGLRLRFLALDDNTECVDDPASAHYNRVVDRARVPAPDWRSSERMRDFDALYRRGAILAHNAAPSVRGAGSCIFLHVWRDAATGTAGCTALAETHVEELLAWLDPRLEPVVVQLPEEEYTRLRATWGLPKR